MASVESLTEELAGYGLLFLKTDSFAVRLLGIDRAPETTVQSTTI